MDAIRQHVRMAIALHEYHRSGIRNRPPSKNPKTYSDAPFEEHSSRVRAGNVRRLYKEVRAGDLVVVPGAAFQPVLFGEITDDFDPKHQISVPGRDYLPIQYRSVKWTRTNVSRSDIPVDLQRYFLKPPAVAEIARTDATERIYSYAYDSYILREKSFTFFPGPDYSGNDPLETSEANQLISYFVAAYSAIERNKLDEFASLNMLDAIETYYDKDLLESYVQVFRSPGYFSMMTKVTLLAAFVASGVTIATTNVMPAAITDGIRITNSASANPNKDQEHLETQLDFLMKSLKEPQLNEMKEKGNRAKKKLGLSAQSKIVKKMKFLRYLWDVLRDTSTPLWVTLLGVGLSAYGAYKITPAINHELEKQKVRTEFVIRNLDSLNGKTQELLAELSIANRKIVEAERGFGENIDKATRLTTELQWKAVELSAVLQDDKSRGILIEFQRTLDEVHSSIQKIKTPDSALLALQKVRMFIPASLAVTRRIAELNSIHFD